MLCGSLQCNAPTFSLQPTPYNWGFNGIGTLFEPNGMTDYCRSVFFPGWIVAGQYEGFVPNGAICGTNMVWLRKIASRLFLHDFIEDFFTIFIMVFRWILCYLCSELNNFTDDSEKSNYCPSLKLAFNI